MAATPLNELLQQGPYNLVIKSRSDDGKVLHLANVQGRVPELRQTVYMKAKDAEQKPVTVVLDCEDVEYLLDLEAPTPSFMVSAVTLRASKEGFEALRATSRFTEAEAP